VGKSASRTTKHAGCCLLELVDPNKEKKVEIKDGGAKEIVVMLKKLEMKEKKYPAGKAKGRAQKYTK
jgi:hypothetical protein